MAYEGSSLSSRAIIKGIGDYEFVPVSLGLFTKLVFARATSHPLEGTFTAEQGHRVSVQINPAGELRIDRNLYKPPAQSIGQDVIDALDRHDPVFDNIPLGGQDRLRLIVHMLDAQFKNVRETYCAGTSVRDPFLTPGHTWVRAVVKTTYNSSDRVYVHGDPETAITISNIPTWVMRRHMHFREMSQYNANGNAKPLALTDIDHAPPGHALVTGSHWPHTRPRLSGSVPRHSIVFFAQPLKVTR